MCISIEGGKSGSLVDAILGSGASVACVFLGFLSDGFVVSGSFGGAVSFLGISGSWACVVLGSQSSCDWIVLGEGSNDWASSKTGSGTGIGSSLGSFLGRSGSLGGGTSSFFERISSASIGGSGGGGGSPFGLSA